MCIIIPLIVGAICALLGYLLGKLLGGGDSNTVDVDLDSYKNKISKLEADLAACEASKSSSAMAASAVAASIPFNAAAAKGVFGKAIKQDDLTLVEGIGPKIQELFHNHGVKTWKDLSECTVEKCQSVLDSGGERYRVHNPGTWPEQAKLAYQGEWGKLKSWQDSLDHGK